MDCAPQGAPRLVSPFYTGRLFTARRNRRGEGIGMPCKSCGSVNQGKFSAEMGIHFLGLKNIDKPVVWVFPKLVVCLDCGATEFVLPDAELCLLAKGDAAAAG